MLSEDIQALGRFKKKAEYLLEFLAEEGQVEAAKFMFVVQGLLDHRVRPSRHDTPPLTPGKAHFPAGPNPSGLR